MGAAKGADLADDEVCACSNGYYFASGFAGSVIGLGLGAIFSFGVQKSGEAATTSASGLLSSGKNMTAVCESYAGMAAEVRSLRRQLNPSQLR